MEQITEIVTKLQNTVNYKIGITEIENMRITMKKQKSRPQKTKIEVMK